VAVTDDWVLGVDVGTSRSAGAMGNGSVTPLEVDGSRWIPSLVLLDAQGNLVVGAAAEHQAGLDPARVERTPKRYLGGAAPLLLGGEPVGVEHAIGQIIEAFAREGRRRHDGHDPALTVLTHPVRWGQHRREALRESARRIGLTNAVLVEEPVAAAVHYVGERVPVGAKLGVYDLGGGTFDTAILQRTEAGRGSGSRSLRAA
jgi:molecular chaperone DnaK